MFSSRSLLVLGCYLLLRTSALSLPQLRQSASDSLKSTATKANTLSPLAPFEGLGSILPDRDSLNFIGRRIIRWGDNSSITDLAWQIPGAYVRDLGSPGQPSQLNLRGLGWYNLAILVDGRLVNEPLLGVANLNLFPLEAIDRIEYESGARAFLYGLNGTGGTVNITTQNYYTNRPYSKIRYSEGGYSYLSTDGIYSQNLLHGVNFTAGFQRRTLDGRFPNSDYDAWNVRVKLRYLLSNRVNLILSESYNRTEVGLNGGVDLSKTAPANVFDELRATMRNTDSFEKVRRHDLTGTLGFRLLGDSLDVSSATVYYSNNLREYRDEENRAHPNGILIRSDHRSAWYGIKLTQQIKEGGNQISLNGELQRREINESPNVGIRIENSLSFSGKDELSFSNLIGAAFGRYDRFRGEDFVSYGADAKLQFLPGLTGFAGYSVSYRTPTLEELYWVGSGISRQSPLQKAKHRLVEAGILSHVGEILELRAAYFHRRVSDAIIAEALETNSIFSSILVRNIPQEILEGVDGSVGVKIWKFSGQGIFSFLTHHREGIEKRIYPKFSANGEMAIRTELFGDHLDLKVGVRGKFFTEQYGEQLNPEAMMYAENHVSTFGPSSSADLFLVGKVGNAFLHLSVENITDERYMLTPYFPMQNRKVRFGVAWEFLD